MKKVLIQGAYDILNAGHVKALKRARESEESPMAQEVLDKIDLGKLVKELKKL